MTSDKDTFGFSVVLADPWIRIGKPCVDEYRSSIDICPMGMDMEKITPGAAINLAYRATKFIEMNGWQNQPMSFVLTLSLARGNNMQGAMSLSQEKNSPHQIYPEKSEETRTPEQMLKDIRGNVAVHPCATPAHIQWLLGQYDAVCADRDAIKVFWGEATKLILNLEAKIQDLTGQIDK